ncbi:MAG: PD40 domain-containing protein [Deltaproteobacteria bacterium]|nr:PD40 domain-containing protein [Deltaproteobacteria bacterium]
MRQRIQGMARAAARCCALLLIALGLLTSLTARSHDPALRWWTIESPHFQVHFPEGERELAMRVARIAEYALARVVEWLEHAPDAPIQVVVMDSADTANGSASVLPYNTVHVYAEAPDSLHVLQDYDDHLQILLVHELTHIVHMDTIHGLPAWINRVLGRTVFPNGAQPVWFTEGLAVHAESAFTSAGRIRSSLFQMYLRTAALGGTFPTLDEASGVSLEWPQGTIPYLVGAFFVDYLAQRFGQTALTDLSQEMSDELIPWSLNAIARSVLDADYLALYDDWRAQVEAEARDQLESIESEGLTPTVPITRGGQIQDRPRISPGGGVLVYYSAPTDDRPSLRTSALDGGGDRELIEVNGAGGAAFRPDGDKIVFSQPEVFEQFYYYQDLFELDLETGHVERLTRGLRARSPDVSPDGRTIVFVRNRSGKSQLAMIGIDGSGLRALTSFSRSEQVYTPRFSPDGRQVVYSASRPDGGRDILLFDLASGSIRRLTDSRCMDMDPVFTPRGDRILFSSDRTGVFNIHEVDPRSGQIRRLTSVLTGAFRPQPALDSSGIAFVLYGPRGFDIAWMDWPEQRFDDRTTRAPRPAPHVEIEPVRYPVEPYRPWTTLLPRSWFPLYGEDPGGTTLGVLFGGQDVIGQISYQAGITMGIESKEVHADLSLKSRLLYPTLSAYFSRHVYRSSGLARVNGEPWPLDRERITLFVDLAFPFSSVRRTDMLFANYDVHWFDSRGEIPFDPMDMEPTLPDDRRLAWLSIGWYGSDVRSYTQSISAEEGLSASLSLRYAHPALGSSARVAEARFWLRTYFPIVRRLHHVLALALQGGLAIGDARSKSAFGVGGLPLRDPVQDIYYGYRYGGLYLRGYAPGAFAGSAYLLASAEYRLPIWTIERGLLTLPFFLQRLHAAVFIDAGGAGPADRGDELLGELCKVGLGAELRLDMLLAYHLPFSLRFGYGRGLMEGGTNNIYLTMGSGF